ncbi:jacalin-like lectin [Haliangium sp.]|uniref:jacalin-like lectin n=1 Tax=Haliangium sp. TaxID=2663208 RepID=UPI003D0A12DD
MKLSTLAIAAAACAAALTTLSSSNPVHADEGREWAVRALKLQAHLGDDVPLSETIWVGTHNSFANPSDDNLMDYNQPVSLEEQLDTGVRHLVFDVHYEHDELRLCHNNTKYRACLDGATGNRKFARGLDDIAEWIREGNHHHVVLLKLSLADSARRNINKVQHKLENQLGRYIFPTTIAPSTHGDLNPDTGCTTLRPDLITKRRVLEAGKNVIVFVAEAPNPDNPSEGCISDGGFNDLVFYGHLTVPQPSSPEELAAAADGDQMLYRVKDGATRDHEFDDARDAKIKPTTVDDWLDAGLNIFEMYGFGATTARWQLKGIEPNTPGEMPVVPEDMVWSWLESQPDDGASRNQGTEDCAAAAVPHGLDDRVCSQVYHLACYGDDTGWVVTDHQGPWWDGFTHCPAGTRFRAPKNKQDLNQLYDAAPGLVRVWVNYNDQLVEGEWVADVPSSNWQYQRRWSVTEIVGGSGGSWFSDFEQLVLDLYRPTRYIAKLEIAAGNRVDKVRVTYSDGREVSHGSNDPNHTMTLDAQEYLGSVEVCVKEKNGSLRVFYLDFTTNRGRHLAGGSREGTCRTFAQDGREIFALRGRSGAEIDAISFYFRQR